MRTFDLAAFLSSVVPRGRNLRFCSHRKDRTSGQSSQWRQALSFGLACKTLDGRRILSSWTFHGKPVPFLPLDYRRGFDTNDPLAAVKLLQAALDQKERVKKASIRVEKINGPILLLSGKADEIWPSPQMANAVCDRLRTKHFRFKYENVQYADAGHTFQDHGNFGGTSEGNAKAGRDAKLRILAFLRTAAGEIGAPP